MKRWFIRRATVVVRHAGMVVVDSEDWDAVLSTNSELFRYVRTSGHINNGRHKSRKRLHLLTLGIMDHLKEGTIIAELK